MKKASPVSSGIRAASDVVRGLTRTAEEQKKRKTGEEEEKEKKKRGEDYG